MTYYIEHRRTVERTGPLVYVPLDEAPRLTGFRSVYAVDGPLRDVILRNGSVSGLESAPVYSDQLFVDYDSNEGVDEAVNTLRGMGLKFEVWDTGRRGVHLHIPIVPAFGNFLPHSQREWVRAHLHGAYDETVYRPHSIIRLPGTYHEKNPGHQKQLLHVEAGTVLNLPRIEAPPPRVHVDAGSGGRDATDFWSAVLSGYQSPGRTFRVFFLGALAGEAGVPFQDGLEAVNEWATTMANPPITNAAEVRRVYANGYSKGASK